MTGAVARALLSHWRRHPGQFAALILGLMLATALWSGVQAINAEARAAYDRAADALAAGDLSRLVRADGQPIAIADYVALRRAGYLVSPVIEAQADGIALLGVDPLTAPPGLIPPDIVAGAAGFADFAGTGAVVFAEAGATLAGAEMRPTDALPPGTGLADIAVVAALTGQTEPSYLVLAPAQPEGLAPIETVTDLELRGPDAANDLGELTGSFHLNLTAFGLLSFGVGLFIAHGAIGLAVEQRRPTIRTLRALGVPLRRMIALLAAELGAFALLAGIGGVLIGYLIAAALLPGVAGTLRGLYGAPVPGELGFDPLWAAAAIAITLVGAAVAGAGALIRIARMPILAPAMPRAWAMRHGRLLVRQVLGALALFALALVLAAFGQGLVLAFAAVGALLLGAALILPPALSAVLDRLAPLLRGPFANWVVADTRQQVPGLSLALMALLLALAANIGVTTMVGSFRETFISWLDQRLGAELYVFAGDQAESRRAFLEPRADAVLPILAVDRPVLGAPGRVRAFADHATYRDTWPLLTATPDAWDALHDGAAVFINEQLSLREGIGLGDPMPVTPDLTLPVAAIYADYGNTRGEALLGAATFTTLFPDVAPFGFSVRAPPEAVPGLMAELRAFGVSQSEMADQQAQKDVSLRVFERTFQVTGALSALTLGVAGLALLIAFLTLAQMRLSQIAPVWAVGATRARLAWAEMIRALALAALTFLVALPVGLALAWMLLNLVNTRAFGWRLPMFAFPADWAALAALAALAAGLAALWPALHLARMAPAKLLQVFANER
ncbi:MAG: ABC transporter permease [Pseudomonadota bacterium]